MRLEINVNFAKLEELVEKLEKYKNAIIDMDKSIKIIERTVEENKGEAFDKLRNVKSTALVHFEKCLEEIEDLLNILRAYINDMTDIISPVNKYENVIVGRGDIYVNLCSIDTSISQMRKVILQGSNRYVPSTYSYGNIDVPNEYTGEDVFLMRKYERNKERVMRMQYAAKRSIDNIINTYLEIKKIYDTKIVDFENMDDKYEYKMDVIYDKYTSIGEWLGDTFHKAGMFVSGVFTSCIQGIAGLFVLSAGLCKLGSGVVKTGWSYAVVKFEWGDKELQNSAQAYIDEVKEGWENLDIMDSLENYCQGWNDTYEKKGPYFAAGMLAGDLYLSGKIMKATKALRAGDEVAGVVGKADDVGKVSKASSKVSKVSKNKINSKASRMEHTLNDIKDIQKEGIVTKEFAVYGIKVKNNMSLGMLGEYILESTLDSISKIDGVKILQTIHSVYDKYGDIIDVLSEVQSIVEKDKE